MLRGWKKLKASLSDNCWVEFDQGELARDSDRVSKTLQNLLGLDDAATGGVATYLRETRPQFTASEMVKKALIQGVDNDEVDSADRLLRRYYLYGKLRDDCPQTLMGIGLPPEEAAEVVKRLADVAEEYGYRMREDAFQIPEFLSEIAIQIESLEYELCYAKAGCHDAQGNLEQQREAYEAYVKQLLEQLSDRASEAYAREEVIRELQAGLENWQHVADYREKSAQHLSQQLIKWQQRSSQQENTVASLQVQLDSLVAELNSREEAVARLAARKKDLIDELTRIKATRTWRFREAASNLLKRGRSTS